MSFDQGYGQSNRSSTAMTVCVVAAVIFVVILTWKPVDNWYQEWRHDRTIASQLEDRLEIQHDLTRSADRVDGNAVVVVDGIMRFTTPIGPMPWECGFHCGVAVKDGDRYKVTLPVGFTYRQDEYQRSDNEEQFTTNRISELTFWSPKEHRLVTVKAVAGAEIPFPEELRARTIDQMKVGEHGYIANTSILETSPNAGVVLGFDPFVGEPGDIMFGNAELTVPVTRTKDGFTVCVPRGGPYIYAPDQKPDGHKLFPARLVDC